MAHGFKVYRTKTLCRKKLLQNFETLRKQFFFLILKLTKHMRERERERERESNNRFEILCLRIGYEIIR